MHAPSTRMMARRMKMTICVDMVSADGMRVTPKRTRTT